MDEACETGIRSFKAFELSWKGEDWMALAPGEDAAGAEEAGAPYPALLPDDQDAGSSRGRAVNCTLVVYQCTRAHSPCPQ